MSESKVKEETHGEQTPLIGQGERVKRGHKCCGCCCDSRRAVIVVDIIDIVFNLCLFAFAILASKVASQQEEELSNMADAMDDDELKALFADANMEEEEKGFLQILPVVVTLSVLNILLDLAGIFGALKFKAPFVIAALVGYALRAVVDIASVNIGALLYAGLFAYPHVFFVLEAKQNIMTQENYHNEEMSCCCV